MSLNPYYEGRGNGADTNVETLTARIGAIPDSPRGSLNLATTAT